MIPVSTFPRSEVGMMLEDPTDVDIAEAGSRFLDHCLIGKRLAAHTLRAYEADLRDFAAYLGKMVLVQDIAREDVLEYARQLLELRKLSAATVKRRLATLKVWFRWMECEDLIPISIFHRLEFSIRIPKRLPRALDREEMRRLLRTTESAVERRNGRRYEARLLHLAVVVLFTTGLRIGELVSVHLEDVSVSDGTVKVNGKGNRERRVYLPGPKAISVMEEFLVLRRNVDTPSRNLLVTAKGSPVTAQYIRTRLRSSALRARISRRVTPHMLRHTAATQLLEADVDIRFVQRLLGHASIVTTQLYTEVRDNALRERVIRANTLSRVSRTGR